MNEESDVIESIIIISMTLMDVREGTRLRITIHGAWCMVVHGASSSKVKMMLCVELSFSPAILFWLPPFVKIPVKVLL